ncbi:hypothetical protein JCM10450v2_000553 [Rhodotorula kratochvilovae]
MTAADTPAPPPVPPRRVSPPSSSTSLAPARPSFWERARSSTVGALDAATKGAIWTAKPAKDQPADDNPFTPASLDVECIRAARILRTFTLDAADLPAEVSLADRRKSQVVLAKIPPEVLAAAQGVAVFTVVRKGVVGSGASGSGVVLARLKDGTWSPPSGILLHTVDTDDESFEKDVYDAVLVLRGDATVAAFKRASVTLGGELSLTTGPVGNGMMLEEQMQEAAIWSYSKSKASHGGVPLEGRVLLERNEENDYGAKTSAAQLLGGEVAKPDWADGLYQTVLAAEGLDFEPYSIPQGPSASECAFSPDPAARSPDDSPNPSTFATSPLLPPTTLTPSNTSPSRISPAPSFLSYFSRTATSTSAQSGAPPTSPQQHRRLPKEELDDEDLAAWREMEAAMRSFGIEDPSVNVRSRAEDPLLEVDARYGEGDPDPESADGTAATGGTGTATPDLTASPGSALALLSDEVEHPPDSPGAKRGNGEDPDATPALRQGAAMSRQGSRAGVGEKPPVPPRRTPRIGTTSAAGSPALAQGEGEDKKEEEVASEEAKDGADEEDKAGEESDSSVKTASEGKEGAEEEGKGEEEEGKKGEEGHQVDEEKKDE